MVPEPFNAAPYYSGRISAYSAVRLIESLRHHGAGGYNALTGYAATFGNIDPLSNLNVIAYKHTI